MANSRTRRRPALIALVLVSAIACLALGWWQWQRFESAGGNGQNLGYAFQWPLFAVFVIYAYRKFVRLESESEAEASGEHAGEPSEKIEREIPADLLPTRQAYADDDDLDDVEARQLLEYNIYLAELDRSRE